MRLVIDYTPAIRQKAGIGRIIRGQVEAFLSISPPQVEVALFVAGSITDDDQKSAPLPLHAFPYISERNLVRLWHRLRSPLPPVNWLTGAADLFHATDFVLAPMRARRKIVTVHDLAFIRFPDASMPGLERYLTNVVPRSILRADFLIADSAHTAQDLQEIWQIQADRIHVVHGAVDHTLFHPEQSPAAIEAMRTHLRLDDRPYILGLSSLQPRKNFVRLIRAYAQLRRRTTLPHRLVIAGGKGWLYDEIFRTIDDLGLHEDVHLPGFVPDNLLPPLYAAADLFAYPSLYEGFGLPILEAQACATPVLSANNSSLPEAGGAGALYVNALSIDEIDQGLERLLVDQPLRDELQRAGLAHAARFTWERSATQLMSAYRRALS